MKRRKLLQLSGAGFGCVLARSSWIDALVANAAPSATSGKVLVWVELRGGNDGLNTVIPFRDPTYHQARPTLSVNEGPALTSALILHLSLIHI